LANTHFRNKISTIILIEVGLPFGAFFTSVTPGWSETSPAPRQERPFLDRGLTPEDIVPMWKATETRNDIAMLPDLIDGRLPEQPRFDGRRHQPAFG
jgi:hypothetical protein